MSNNTIISPDKISNLLQEQLFTSSDINKFAGSISHFFWSNCDNFRKEENVRFTSHENVDYCSSYACIGDFDIGSRRTLPLVIFHLQPDKIINDRQGKKTQFDIIKKWLKQNNYDSAIAIFVSNKLDSFRISYVYSIYSGAKRTFSHYKRYSFYVDKDLPNKTFIQRLSQYPIDSEKNIIELFSVDKLTKEFYEEIQTWYYEALKHVRFPEDIPIQENPKNATNLIRLLTRLIFCWFIKERDVIPKRGDIPKRGIIPDKLFDPTELSNILKEFNKDKNSRYYYNAILQNLFFASLNTPVEKRDFAIETNDPEERKKHFGVKNLYRYKDFFNISKDKAIKLFQGVPFLNGGLFDCLDKEDIQNKKAYYIDGFSRNPEKQAIVPDWLFFHDNPITVDLSEFGLGKKTFRGLIDILKSYNFTTDENSPIDEEVALDPELLGHIFENLLASFNPETASTARKSSGSYYTPREIVDYMVTESLFYYFQTHCPEISEDKIRLLLSYSDEKIDLSDSEKKRLIEAIFKIKVLDPACGSGAFPMGVLHKLVFALQKIDPENQYWKKQILSDVTKKFEQALLKIKNKEEREKIFKELNEVFENNTDDYSRKLFLIENCIYGVDIQNIAIQISKLRFFISLFIEQEIIAITEQDINAKKANYDLKPLPNLETKFVVANTLIGLDKPALPSLRNLEIEALETKLKDLRHKYFTIQTREEKLRIRKKDKSIREKIAEHLIKDGWDDFTARKIAAFDPYDQNASADWFDPEWMFGITDGFDIVIGNPPYIQLQRAFNNTLKFADLYKEQNFKTFDRTGDIYCLFYEKGIQLLKDNGLLAYITSNKWMRAAYGEKLREFFRKQNPLQLVDLGPEVFENATVDTNILIIQKANNQNKLKAITLQKQDKEDIFKALKEKAVVLTKLSKDAWFIGSDAEQKLKEKIEKIGKPLKDWDVKIYRGVLTGLNEAFIITTEKRNEILANCKDKEERKRTEQIIKPILRGRDIKRYYYEWAGLWVIIIPAGWTNENRRKEKPYDFIQRSFPSLIQYLKLFETKAKKRDDQGDYWWELRHCAYYPEFEKEKVVWQRITQEPTFCLVEPNVFILDSMAFFTGKNLKFIMTLLNSKLIYKYVEMIVHQYGFTGFRLSNQYVEIMPLPPITASNQGIVSQIENLVDKILSAKKQNPQADTSEYENEINKLVYKLYDLSEEEIKIIEK